MKRPVRPSLKRGSKTTSIKLRIDPRQKKFWEKEITALGVDDVSAYIRKAVDRSIGLDFQSKDPKWQAFLRATEEQAKKFFGQKLEDNLEGRLSSIIEKIAPLKKSKNK